MRDHKKEQQVRRMSDWYMEGYTKQTVFDGKTGKTKTELVYQGLYYTYEVENITVFKLLCAVLSLFYLAFSVVPWFLPSYIAGYTWAGAVGFLMAIPLVFLVIGCLFFLLQEIPLTTRQTYAGYWRIVRSFNYGFWIQLAILLCGIIWLILNSGMFRALTNELVYLGVLLAALVYNRICIRLIRKGTPVDVPED